MAKSIGAMKRSSNGGGGGNEAKERTSQTAERSAASDISKLLTGLPESERKDLYVRVGMPNDQILARMTEEEKANAAKYSIGMLNIALPELSGVSQKQIDYARDRRARRLAEEYRRLHDNAERTAQNAAYREKKTVRQVIDEMFQRAGAANMSELLEKALRTRPAWRSYGEETSADKILNG